MANVVPKRWDDIQREYAEELRRLAELAFRRYSRNLYELLYLAGTKRTGLDTHNPSRWVWERLTVASATEVSGREELEVVRGDEVPRNLTVDGLVSWFRERLAKEPLAIFAD